VAAVARGGLGADPSVRPREPAGSRVLVVRRGGSRRVRWVGLTLAVACVLTAGVHQLRVASRSTDLVGCTPAGQLDDCGLGTLTATSEAEPTARGGVALRPSPSPPPAARSSAGPPVAVPSPGEPSEQNTAHGAATLTADSGRPFAPTSAWNTRLPADPVVDADSAAMIAGVTPGGRAFANLYEFGDPVFTADADTPTATVECTQDWGPCPLEQRPLRIPLEARAAPGSDGRVIVVDLVNRTSCDFWQATRLSATRWTASWGTCADLDGDGRGPGTGGATGAKVNALTGVVRTFEMRNREIPHALSVATNNSCRSGFRYPALGSDGLSSRPDCVPEGARLQLDPSIDVDALPGITPGEKAVARALQIYGAINRDNSASPLCISFEAPIGEPDPYPAAGFGWDYYDMPHIPWDRLRVLHSSDGS